MPTIAKRISAFLFVAFLILPFKLYAWGVIGHQVVANIAYQNLKPDVRERVDEIISHLTEQYPTIKSFQQAAFWPDAIRDQRIETFTHWHYIDNSISTDGSPLKNLIDTDNASWAFHNVVIVAKNEKANPYERTRFLTFLEHIVGDLHQPLHTVTNITAKNSNGDKGGNMTYVIYKNNRINLHKLWDEGCGLFEGSSSNKHIDELAQEISAKYPAAFFGDRVNDLNQEDWINESIDNAKAYVYVTTDGGPVTEAYLQNGRDVAMRSAALAGYRLAALLNQII